MNEQKGPLNKALDQLPWWARGAVYVLVIIAILILIACAALLLIAIGKVMIWAINS